MLSLILVIIIIIILFFIIFINAIHSYSMNDEIEGIISKSNSPLNSM